jgi:hypothetical protein
MDFAFCGRVYVLLFGHRNPMGGEGADVMKHIIFAIVISVLGLAISASDAHASDWQSVASGCVVRPSDASKAEFDPVYGTVTFASGQTGTIKLTCPITAFFGGAGVNPNLFYAIWSDSDGLSGGCQTWTDVLRAGINTSSPSFATVASIYSATPGYPTSSVRTKVYQGFGHTWDTHTHHYWVIIEMQRNTTAQNCTAYGVGLQTGIP